MQQMEGSQYSITLDLNMGYYTIDLSSNICDIMTIFTEFGKLRYNRFLMGLFTSGNTFQAKLYEIISDIEGYGYISIT